MPAEGLKLQNCPDCGISFDSDIPECPECGKRIAVRRSRVVLIVMAVVLALAIIAALWATSITPISPDF
jgi:uncharacterized paraquat-inducible protein A